MTIEAPSGDYSIAAGKPQTEPDLEAERRQAIIDQGMTNLVKGLFGDNELSLNASQLVLAGEIISLQLDSISDKERQMVEKRFGLLGDEPMSFEELGGAFGLSKNKARGQVSRAVRKLRFPDRLDSLREVIGIPIDSTHPDQPF